MNELRIKFTGRMDKNNHEYFFSICDVPATVDLRDTVLLFFPEAEDEQGRFRGELVVKKHDRESGEK